LIRALIGLALALAGALGWQAAAHAQTHRAALVVEHDSKWPGAHVLLKCVEFAADAISGLTLLELAGVNSGQPPQIYDWGGGAFTVCQVDHEPSQVPERCFGPAAGPNWSDWSVTASGWVARSSGASGYLIQDGDTEGWTYTAAFGAPPPSIRFSQVCASVPAIRPTSALATVTRPPAVAPRATASAAPSESASAVALAPSISPAGPAVLASTGPPTPPPTSPGIARWLLLGTVATLLLGLGAFNLRRRGP
jgi:hypothetical protein